MPQGRRARMSDRAALRWRAEENHTQDAHTRHTVWARRHPALSNPTAGRGEHISMIGYLARVGMIGPHLQSCGGPQTTSVSMRFQLRGAVAAVVWVDRHYTQLTRHVALC